MLGFFDTFPWLLYSLRLPTLPRYVLSLVRVTKRDVKPLTLLPPNYRQVDTWLRTGRYARQLGLFGKLSPELLDIIFDNVFSMGDIIQFSITCKLALEVGKRHLLSALRRYHAPWAGKRLICLGEWTQDSDLPQGLLTAFEQQELLTADVPSVAEDLRLSGKKMDLVTYASETYLCKYGTIGRAMELRWTYWKIMRKKRAAIKDDPRSNRDLDMFHELYIYSKPTYPEGPLVLCNLSKAEYVREDRLRKMEWDEEWEGTYYALPLGLVHALIARICWSGAGVPPLFRGELGIGEQLAKGPWAGDRFSITTLETMPQPKDAKEWTDVTAEVDELLFRIWERYCAPYRHLVS